VLQEAIAMKLYENLQSSIHGCSRFLSTMLMVALIVAVVVALSGSAFAGEHVIYNFAGGNDGIGSNDLIADSAGNLYGTTFDGGGSAGAGIVYRLSPPAQQGGSWTETILYSFSFANLLGGIGPKAGLAMDGAGNLYGTTWLGGPGGGGIVFELSPPALQGGAWTFSLLYGFGTAANDLISPESRLVIDKAGNLYGTAVSGGTGLCAGGCGGIFKVAPPAQPGGAWTETVLFNFRGWFNRDGGGSGGTNGGVTLDANGALYGTALPPGNVAGIIFKLTPPKHKNGKSWAHTLLYAFQGGADGYGPNNLAFDKNGNLFGTTSYGGDGAQNCFGGTCGTIFQLTPTPSGPWTHTVLYSFNGGTDGGFEYPGSPLIFDAAGNLYGTTPIGGDPGCIDDAVQGCGTVFRLSPPVVQGAPWTETVLYRFAGGGNGAGPGGLTFGKRGLLYGPAGFGANADGLIFSVTP
jgi:uncharacterized repeat protein (TIGR03803 family)